MQTDSKSSHNLAMLWDRLFNDHLRARPTLDNQVFAILGYCSHLCRETIASSGQRHDVALVLGSVPKRSSKYKDVLAEVGFLDKRIRPHSFHQLVFGNYLSTVANESQQRFERFWRESYGLVLAQ